MKDLSVYSTVLLFLWLMNIGLATNASAFSLPITTNDVFENDELKVEIFQKLEKLRRISPSDFHHQSKMQYLTASCSFSGNSGDYTDCYFNLCGGANYTITACATCTGTLVQGLYPTGSDGQYSTTNCGGGCLPSYSFAPSFDYGTCHDTELIVICYGASCSGTYQVSSHFFPTILPTQTPSVSPTVSSVPSVSFTPTSAPTTGVTVGGSSSFFIPTSSYTVSSVSIDSLDEISVVSGYFSGQAIGFTQAISAVCLCTSCTTSTTQRTYLMSLGVASSEYSKIVALSFTISSNALSIYATTAKYTDGGGNTGSCSLIQNVYTSGSTMSVATCDSCGGYGIKGLVLSGAAVTPTLMPTSPTIAPTAAPTTPTVVPTTIAPSVVPTASPTFGSFIPSGVTCSAPPSSAPTDCSLTCGGTVIDLSDVIVTDTSSYTEREFHYSSSSYEYYAIVPVCGNEPTFPSPYSSSVSPTPTWSSSDIWQFANTDSYKLGSFNSSTWKYGSCNGAGAVRVSFTAGQACSGGVVRSTTVHLVCATGYTASSPYVVLTETNSLCVYELYIGMVELCSLPLLTVSPTVAPSMAPSMLPSIAPTIKPTLVPSIKPTVAPTIAPSLLPSVIPTITSVPTTAAPSETVAPSGPTFSPTSAFYSPSGVTCTSPPVVAPTDCSLDCAGTSVDLTSIVVTSTSTYTERIFHVSDNFEFYVIFPVCGNEPAFPSPYDVNVKPTPNWTTSDIWQLKNNEGFYLGSIDSTSWQYGSYNGAGALKVSYTDGQKCGSNGIDRRTTVYLVCLSGYSATSPSVIESEPSTCVYVIQIGLSEMCSFPLLTAAPTLSPSQVPSAIPTTSTPTVVATMSPSLVPTTASPTLRPTSVSPTRSPTSPPVSSVSVGNGDLIPTSDLTVDGLTISSLDQIVDVSGSIVSIDGRRRKLMSVLDTSTLGTADWCLSTSDTSTTADRTYLFHCLSANVTYVVAVEFTVSTSRLTLVTTTAKSRTGNHTASCSAVRAVYTSGSSLSLATCDTCSGYGVNSMSLSTTAVFVSSSPSVGPTASPAADSGGSTSSGLAIGAIIGIVVGAVLIIGLIVAYYVRSKRLKKAKVAAGEGAGVQLAAVNKEAELQKAEEGLAAQPIPVPQPMPATYQAQVPVMQYPGPGYYQPQMYQPAPPVPRDRQVDFFLSFANDKKEENLTKIEMINDYLVRTGRTTWLDVNQPKEYEEGRNFAAINNSRVYVIFLTKLYSDRIDQTAADSQGEPYSYHKEFDMAVAKHGAASCKLVILEKEMFFSSAWKSIDSYLGGELNYRWGPDESVKDVLSALDDEVEVSPEFKNIAEELRSKLIKEFEDKKAAAVKPAAEKPVSDKGAEGS